MVPLGAEERMSIVGPLCCGRHDVIGEPGATVSRLRLSSLAVERDESLSNTQLQHGIVPSGCNGESDSPAGRVDAGDVPLRNRFCRCRFKNPRVKKHGQLAP